MCGQLCSQDLKIREIHFGSLLEGVGEKSRENRIEFSLEREKGS